MAWYQVKGNDTDTVISTRIRLARNLEGYAFGRRLDDEGRRAVIDKIEAALSGEGFTKTDVAALSPVAAQALAEEHLISPQFAAAKGPRALFRHDGKSIYVMAPEEDHIRLQCILPGLALRDAFAIACAAEEKLDAALPLAFDENLGYLTHCPSNLGTGLRASVMLFLPALSDAGMINSLSHQLSKLGLTIRGTWGEGSSAHGAIYQVSNQVTLGLSEEDILSKLEEATAGIIAAERKARASITGEARLVREDRIHRAEGILRYATRLSSEELFSLYKDLKQGIGEGLITSITSEDLNTLLIHAQPAILTYREGEGQLSPTARDTKRATFIKNALEVTKHG